MLIRKVLFSMLIIFLTGLSATAQVTVKGKITNADNRPVRGANIVVKNTNMATASDENGNYQISAPNANAVLAFSFIGYERQEQPIGNRSVIDVVLEESASALDEVVIVGYSAIKRQSLTGAVSTLDNKKLMDATTPSVENLLQGKAAGVYVNSGSGQPGEVARIIIRGKTTINGSTDPLWVIDGVIVGSSAYTLNPIDVESITVLRDAASTAIYGSQGANGVIIVTTKKGQPGKAVVNASARLAAAVLNNGNFDVMNGAELYDLYNSFPDKSKLEATSWWNPELRNRNFNWWDNATQTGFAQDYNVSISGGQEDIKTYVSLGLYDETGAIKGYDFSRYNALLKVDYRVFDRLTIKPQINVSQTKILNRQHSVSAMYTNFPWDSPYNEDGTLVGLPPQSNWVNSSRTNYLYDTQWNYIESDEYNVFASFDFDFRILDWLTYASVNNLKFSHYIYMGYTDPRSSGGQSADGTVQDYMRTYNRVYSNQLLRINKSFGNHAINAVFGYEWNEYNSKITDQIGAGLSPGTIVADGTAIPQKAKGSRSQWAMQNLLSNINYTYDGRYLAQFSFRRDGASNFGLNAQYGNFFSISGGWNIHNEEFFNFEPVNNLKLRASYGSVGNRPNSLYGHFTLFSGKVNYNGIPGNLISQIGDPNLTWEKSFVTNVGLDASFLERVNLSLDFYYKNTSDLLYQVPVSGVTGVTNVWKNVGAVKNRGFEISVDADIIKNRDLVWNIDANIGLNRNKVTTLYGSMKQIVIGDGSNIAGSASKLLKPGEDADSWYLAEWAGVDPETGKAQWYTTNTEGERVKTFNYAQAAANRVIMGSYTPKFFGGFGTHLNYKSFDFAALFNYSVGGKIYNYARAEFDSDGAYVDRNQMNLQSGWSRWEKPGDIATHPQAIYGNATNSNKVSSRFLESGTFLKLRSVTLGYSIPIKKWRISNLRVFVSGENLLTFTKFSGVDPEIPPREGVITGVATSIYPQVRRIAFGVNVTF